MLNWGYGGFSPITLNSDYASSLQQLKERLEWLQGLDYAALLDEATSANGKAWLRKYQQTESSVEYSLHFMRDRQTLIEMLQPDEWQDGKHITNPTRMFRGILESAKELKKKGVWSDTQVIEYCLTVSNIERAFEKRLKEFACAYDYRAEPKQIPPELATKEAEKYFDKAIELKLMDSKYRWLKGFQMLACFAREMSVRLHLGKGERIAWKPFETLFNVPPGKLRLNYNDIQKTGQAPKESYLIDKIFQ